MAGILDRWRTPEGSKRRYRRVGTSLVGAFVAGGQRHSGKVLNISPGGVCLAAENPAGLHEGGEGIFELTDFGEFPARICYVVSGGIGLDFRLDDRRREAFAEWLAGRRETEASSSLEC